MAVELGLRERKKLQTRQQIFEAARKLFAERGFDSVTVADIARAADVSEVTVFNYFPTKEDLFYGGMQFFEEQLIQAVRDRARSETPLKALRRTLIDSADSLASRERIDAIIRATTAVNGSPSLAAREREIVERYTRRLAGLLAGDPEDVQALATASALMGAHRAVVDHTRKLVLNGVRGRALVAQTRAAIRRAYGPLEKGL
ncbi:MAG TPA: TetR family transcriptional regulator [Candidatus Dormibacteraeota bacterium]|nr:TetR family transcriptional regulator [Candidatus Dormibacteraeota bacterium]